MAQLQAASLALPPGELSLSKKPFRQAEASFCNFKKLQKLIDLTRKTPLLGFFRNYLPSRIRTLFSFFDKLKETALHDEVRFLLLFIAFYLL